MALMPMGIVLSGTNPSSGDVISVTFSVWGAGVGENPITVAGGGLVTITATSSGGSETPTSMALRLFQGISGNTSLSGYGVTVTNPSAGTVIIQRAAPYGNAITVKSTTATTVEIDV